MKDTVPKQRKNYEVDRGPHAGLNPSLRSNPIIHDFIPVLSSQDLKKHTHGLNMYFTVVNISIHKRQGYWRCSLTQQSLGKGKEYTLDVSPVHHRTHTQCSDVFSNVVGNQRFHPDSNPKTILPSEDCAYCHHACLLPLVTDLKHGHYGCREGVKVCRRVVLKDEPVTEPRRENNAELCCVLFCSCRNQFSSSQETRQITLHALCFPKGQARPVSVFLRSIMCMCFSGNHRMLNIPQIKRIGNSVFPYFMLNYS